MRTGAKSAAHRKERREASFSGLSCSVPVRACASTQRKIAERCLKSDYRFGMPDVSFAAVLDSPGPAQCVWIAVAPSTAAHKREEGGELRWPRPLGDGARLPM